MEKEDLLEQPIQKLGLSENFYLRSKLMGFHSLAEIIKTPAGTIIRKEEFSYTWLGELAKFLASKGLLHYLQPVPGTPYLMNP